jgi:hypothetical protein
MAYSSGTYYPCGSIPDRLITAAKAPTGTQPIRHMDKIASGVPRGEMIQILEACGSVEVNDKWRPAGRSLLQCHFEVLDRWVKHA